MFGRTGKNQPSSGSVTLPDRYGHPLGNLNCAGARSCWRNFFTMFS
jgi:hypothetical protein